jgi:hypothetical protein
MDFKTKYMIGLEERISLTEKLTILQAQLKQQEMINNDLMKHINSIENKCPHCSLDATQTSIVSTIVPIEQEQNCKELDSMQACEELPFPTTSYKSTPKPLQGIVDSQQTFSGKKPFNYEQLKMIEPDLCLDSDSDSHSEKSDGDQIDLDDDRLVPWTEIVRQNHPKLLNSGNKSAWEKYVLEFLGKLL